MGKNTKFKISFKTNKVAYLKTEICVKEYRSTYTSSKKNSHIYIKNIDRQRQARAHTHTHTHTHTQTHTHTHTHTHTKTET